MGEGAFKQLGIDTHPELRQQGPRGEAGVNRLVPDQDARTCRRAARGPYWPQEGHATCGRCFSRQAGFTQVTSAGTDAFHWERRCRVLLRDILRLGTATISSPFLRLGRRVGLSPCLPSHRKIRSSGSQEFAISPNGHPIAAREHGRAGC